MSKTGRMVRLLKIAEHTRVYKHATRTGFDARNSRYTIEHSLYERLYEAQTAAGEQGKSVFSWRDDSFFTDQWVGVIEIEGLCIEIIPKTKTAEAPKTHLSSPGDAQSIDQKNFLVMLSLSGHIPVRSEDLAHLDTKELPLHELLYSLFAKMLDDEMRRGRDECYVDVNANIYSVRGKIDFIRHLADNCIHQERVACTFQEVTAETAINQIIIAACLLVQQRTGQHQTKDAMNRILSMLPEVNRRALASDWCDRIVYTRKNERFSKIIQFCKVILANQAPTASQGDNQMLSLLFDMNKVFEKFLTNMLEEGIVHSRKTWSLIEQGAGDARCLAVEGRHPIFRLKPDIVVRDRIKRDRIVILDCKWKRIKESSIGSERRMSQVVDSADGYQMFAYIKQYGATAGVLLYPGRQGQKGHVAHFLNASEVRQEALLLRCVPLDRDLRLDTELLALQQALVAAVTDGLAGGAT